MRNKKKAKIDWVSFTGNRELVIPKTPETEHFTDGSVLQSKNGKQFKLVEKDDLFELRPITSGNVPEQIAYHLEGNLSDEINEKLSALPGRDRLSICRELGVV